LEIIKKNGKGYEALIRDDQLMSLIYKDVARKLNWNLNEIDTIRKRGRKKLDSDKKLESYNIENKEKFIVTFVKESYEIRDDLYEVAILHEKNIIVWKIWDYLDLRMMKWMFRKEMRLKISIQLR
jgi:hypothetical protein